jgi:uncharacterized membrane protein
MIEQPLNITSINIAPKSSLRRYFFTGILITAPVGLTLYLAWIFIAWVDRLVTPYLADWMNPNRLLPFDVPGVGLLVVLVGLTLIGAIMTGILGKWFTGLVEAVLNRVPVVKTIYTVIKQVLQTALTDQSTAFKEPVLVEFPRKDSWVLAFATARDRANIDKVLGNKMVGVFVPTTPNLTSGYLIFVAESEVKHTNISSEEALKLIISAGLVN